MSRYFHDYVWKNGLPYGIQPITTSEIPQEVSYKIPSDPYHKRISIEKYSQGSFSGIIYESALFDFRHLKLGEQLAWQKLLISETDTTAICHIRNQDDRLVLIEHYRFESQLCRECHVFSPMGNLLSVQKITYQLFNDLTNGVTLFDSNDHPVMSKFYHFDENAKEFTDLLKEDWALK